MSHSPHANSSDEDLPQEDDWQLTFKPKSALDIDEDDEKPSNPPLSVEESSSSEAPTSEPEKQDQIDENEDFQLTFVPKPKEVTPSDDKAENKTTEDKNTNATTLVTPVVVTPSKPESNTPTKKDDKRKSDKKDKKDKNHGSVSPKKRDSSKHRSDKKRTSKKDDKRGSKDANTSAVTSNTNASTNNNTNESPSNNTNAPSENNTNVVKPETTGDESVGKEKVDGTDARVMSKEEEEDLENMRKERQQGRKRHGAFYAGNSKSKIGLDAKEEIPEAPSSSSGTVAFSSATFISTDGRITKHNIQTRVKNKSKRFIIAFADTMGRRANMEDDFFIGGQYRGSSDEDFIAIFDGHAGPDVAHYAAYQLPITMQEMMKKNNNIQLCFKKAFYELNQQLKQKKILGGTTVLSCYFHQQELYIANLGDCRAVALNADGKSVRLTRDHRPDAPEEQRRIEKLGGEVTTAVTKEGKLVSRVNGVLGVARALGDFDLEPFINAEPEVFVFHPQSEKHNFKAIIIACDGLWDVLEDQEAVDIISPFLKDHEIEKACARLRNVAYARGSTDNVTAVVIQLLDQEEITALKKSNGGKSGWCSVS
jgi:serine/threonine protein phosphatase PrpC